jgi:eukaryotic-like serine/threonine-protein kinase
VHTKPLRPHDPRVLGDYEMLGLLGEGGMGAVYLAQARDGQQVAVKIIKPEYAVQAEFRGRFRSEVNRARQVPPFCTAAVLDADPDHETPYLVVEYVDGPNLAEVISQQGPLSGGNLHSVAVGVATALVAIHGAGVIHRDLKPPNVLFALGSPKVIDFGIARALESTTEHTRPDQMVGTLSYMAPERLDGAAATAAMDVFAWGVLVAYAATGRTPFAADSSTAIAVRILTAEPDLDGLTGALRDLVERALAKQPSERPTAQELLDLLLTAGPEAAALSPRPRTEPIIDPPTPKRGRLRLAVVAATAVAVAAGALLGMRADREVDASTGVVAAASSPALVASSIVDPLTKPGKWSEKRTEKYSCEFDEDGFLIASETSDNVICPGSSTSFTGDLSVRVNFQDLTRDACALVRFRFQGKAGYELSVCRSTVSFTLYPVVGETRTLSYKDVAVDLASRHQIRIDVADDIATCRLDGKAVLTAVVSDPGLTRGILGLGLVQSEDGTEGSVRFLNLQASDERGR